MSWKLINSLVFFYMLCALTANAQLLINEVSQGASGAKEYVEFVVVGNFKCDPNQNCVDLRNWYLDDNNGYHSASTSGSGIANGSLRLTNHPIWSCVPIGTLLLIYNGSDMPVNMPATDTSLNDGNCRLVIPIDSTKSGICRFIVKNNQFPNQTNPTYPAGGFSSCPTGPSWTVVGMANGNDSYHTVTATGTIVHAVSWGNNNLNTNIYFSGSAGGLVYAMENIVNNDPYNQANWTSKSATTAETPGLPNSTANANWINYLTNHCSPRTPFSAAFSGLSPLCGQCNGTLTTNGSGGIYPYQVSLNGINQSSNNITGLCQGNYLLTITDSIGCTFDSLFQFNPTSSAHLTTVASSSAICVGDSVKIVVSGSTQLNWLPTQTVSQQNDSTFWVKPTTTSTYSFITGNAQCGDTAYVPVTVNALPSVSAGNSVSLCSGQSAQLQANGAQTYSWIPATGLSSTNVSNPNVNTLTTTLYTVIGTSGGGCVKSDTVRVFVRNTPIVNITGNTTVCNGENTILTATGATTYSWLPTSNFLGSLQNAIQINPNQSATYTVVGYNGNCKDTSTINITVNIKPLVQFATTPVCHGDVYSQTLTANTPNTNYSWWFNGNYVTSGNSASISTSACGTFSITVLGINANGCRDSLTQSMVINCKPQADFTGLPTQICSGQSVQLQNNSTTNTGSTLTYTWLNNGNLFSNQENPLTTFNDTGLINVTLVSSVLQCKDSIIKSIHVSVSPQVTLTADTVCLGNATHLTINTSNTNSSTTYSWNFGNGTTSSSSGNQTYNYTNAQNYTVTLIVTNNHCADTASVTAIVATLPTYNFSYTNTCVGQATNFSIQNAGSAASFSWDLNNDGIIDGYGKNITHTFTQSGSNTIKIIQTSAGGCSDTVKKIIMLHNKPVAKINPSVNEVCEPNCLQLKGDSTLNNTWVVSNFVKTGSTSKWCLPVGNYSVKLLVTDSTGCKDSLLLSNYLHINPKPNATFFVNPTEMSLFGKQPEFTIANPVIGSYAVNFGDSTTLSHQQTQYFTHAYKDTGTYYITLWMISNKGCKDSANATIKVIPEFMIYIPNAFTPNNDIFNENFKPIIVGASPNDYIFRVFDRWGYLIFETTDLQQGWNGTYKGSPCPIDHYAYTIKVMDIRQREYHRYGTVTLVR